MDIHSTEDIIGITIWYLEAVTGLCAHAVAFYFLYSLKTRKVGDLLILHLCCAEVLWIVWNVIHYSFYIHGRLSEESKLHTTGKMVLFTNFYLIILWITLDRVVAIKFTFWYLVALTKLKMVAILTLTWIISFGVGFTFWILPAGRQRIIWVIQDSVCATVLILGYAYIIVKVYTQKKKFNNKSSSSRAPHFKLKIPLYLVTSHLCTIFIPDLVLIANENYYCVWFQVVWYLNFICDPVIYVSLTKRKRQRILARGASFRNSGV